MARTRRGPHTQGKCLRRRSNQTYGWVGPTVGQSDRPSVRVADRPSELSRNTFQQAEQQLSSARRIVSFNGPYTLDQIQSRMARIDWSVVPSVWWEIFGLVISEAWMFGKPVICSNAGGMAERVTHEQDGLHFEMGDPASLAATIRRACSEDGLWERLHAAVPEAPVRAVMADEYLAVYALGNG